MFCPPWPAAVAVRLSFTVQEGFLYLRSSKIFGCTYDSIQSGVHKIRRAGYRVYDSPEYYSLDSRLVSGYQKGTFGQQNCHKFDLNIISVVIFSFNYI